jgi:hypothetical protein
MTELSARLETQRKMAELLEARNDDEILELPMENESVSFWSKAGTVRLDGTPVFVKRVPLTDPEVQSPYSTRNHYDLPDFYHYGVGSAGFGAYRELAGLKKASALVASGVAPAFPVLYHHRVLHCAAEPWRPWRGQLTQEEYIAYWGSSPAVARCIAGRAAASHELWLFLESFPQVVSDWLPDHQEATSSAIEQLAESAAALRSAGFVHFDAHLGNAVTDGTLIALVDFGLVSALEFEQSPAERMFVARHRHYDLGVIIASCHAWIMAAIAGRLSEERRSEVRKACRVAEESSYLEFMMGLLEHSRTLVGTMDLGAAFVESTERYLEVIRYMQTFLEDLQSGPAKDATYDDYELFARLKAADAPGLD